MDRFSLKILLCDDSVMIRKKFIGMLNENGFTNILEAQDGQAAVDLCKEHDPDLVFLDIVMPNKDGLEALVEIKQHNPDIHVVMASSVGTQANLLKALKLGANNFVQKPITMDLVLDIVNKIIDGRGDN